MKNLILAALIALSTTSQAQTSTKNKTMAFNRAQGVDTNEVYTTNQSFDKSTTTVTAESGAAPALTTSLNLFGKASLILTGTANTDRWRIRTEPFPTANPTGSLGNGLNGQNCQTRFVFSSAYGGPVTTSEWSGYIRNQAGTTIAQAQVLPGTYDISVPQPQSARTVIFFYPCPYSATAANNYVDLVITHTTNNTASIVIDEVRPTYATDIGQGVPNNNFSAFISSTGVVAQENEDFINGNCTVSSPNVTCTFVTGKFTQGPNCVVGAADANNFISSIGTLNSTTLIYMPKNTANAFAATGVFVTCQKSGSDFIQPTITPNQYDFINEFGANVTSGGVVSSENQDWISGNCASGGTGIFNCTMLTGKFAAAPTITVTNLDTGTGTVCNIQNGTTTTAFSVRCWTANTGALVNAAFAVHATRTTDYRSQASTPILIGSVTSNAPNSEKIVRVMSSAVCTTGTCALGGSSGDASVTFSSTGTYVIAFTQAFGNATYSCVSNAESAGSTNAVSRIPIASRTSTGALLVCTTPNTNATVNCAFDFVCTGQR